MNLYCLGGDISLYYDNYSVERWMTTGWAERYVTDVMEFYQVKLIMELPNCKTFRKSNVSTYTPEKFERVLQIFDGFAWKVIPCLWNDAPMDQAFDVAAIKFVEKWGQDNRIAAFQPFSEITPSNLQGYSREQYIKTVNLVITDMQKFTSKPIIYPTNIFLGTLPTWWQELQDGGAFDLNNVVFDSIHPYYFENSNDMGLSPEAKADYYKETWLQPFVSRVGASRVFVGETFGWGQTHSPERQIQFLAQMIRNMEALKVSFCLFAHSSYRAQNLEALKLAGFVVPEEEEEPPTPKPSFAARSIGPLGVPTALLHQLWKLREKVIRPEVHKKLHPIV